MKGQATHSALKCLADVVVDPPPSLDGTQLSSVEELKGYSDIETSLEQASAAGKYDAQLLQESKALILTITGTLDQTIATSATAIGADSWREGCISLPNNRESNWIAKLRIAGWFSWWSQGISVLHCVRPFPMESV